jgi:hypothetical protein
MSRKVAWEASNYLIAEFKDVSHDLHCYLDCDRNKSRC